MLAVIVAVGKGLTVTVAVPLTARVQAGVVFDVTSTNEYVESIVKIGVVTTAVPAAFKTTVCCVPPSTV